MSTLWVQEEHDNDVNNLFWKSSAILSSSEIFEMEGDTYDHPEGSVLKSVKLGSKLPVDTSDHQAVEAIQRDWANKAAICFDNACIGALNGEFKSLYQVSDWVRNSSFGFYEDEWIIIAHPDLENDIYRGNNIVIWSSGARVSDEPVSNPTGSPLAVTFSRRNLLVGHRSGSGPETSFPEEGKMLMRVRMGFTIRRPEEVKVMVKK